MTKNKLFSVSQEAEVDDDGVRVITLIHDSNSFYLSGSVVSVLTDTHSQWRGVL